MSEMTPKRESLSFNRGCLLLGEIFMRMTRVGMSTVQSVFFSRIFIFEMVAPHDVELAT